MFAITRTRSPLAERLGSNGLNRLLDDAFFGWPFTPSDTPLVGNWMPPVDVIEDSNQVRIAAELPGVKPEDVSISLENQVLTIRGEKKQNTEESNDRTHRFERSYGVFERGFTVPSTVDADKIQASYEHGVLTVTLPKVERAKPRQIQVKVQA